MSTEPQSIPEEFAAYIDPNGPENPIHQLDVFSKGLPVRKDFFNGYRRKQNEIEMTEHAMHVTQLGLDIRPQTLVSNPRAHLFPDKIESVIVCDIIDHDRLYL